MKYKKNLLFIVLFLIGCNNNNSVVISEKESDEPIVFVDFKTIKIEQNEKYYYGNIVKDFKDISIDVLDNNIASVENNYVVGKNKGSTKLRLIYNNETQYVNIYVKDIDTYSSSFSFDDARLYGKNIVAFGDSVTATSTIGTNKTYVDLFANKFNMNFVRNYAIGGTTATYMYEGSNIYKEYKDNTNAIDGCRVVYNAYTNNELNNIDYAFIAFGHNDQYFQPPISADGDDKYCIDNTFASAHSFKGSYRYMINVLKKANPNIRIILLNCTYSEYDKNLKSPYGEEYTYFDYRVAIKEIANEFNCRYIDPWDYLKEYFDFKKENYYYKDSVHLSINGHKKFYEYIIEN